MLQDERLDPSELTRIGDEIREDWAVEDLDFEEAVDYHDSLPAGKRFADVLESADRPLLQPRAGVPRLDDQIALLRHLEDEGKADLLPTTIDSYTRDNEYGKAQSGLEEARETGEDTLNGFPAVNHGVEGCRDLVEALDAPIEVRHGTPDARLLAAVTFAGGFQSFEGGPISYNIPYTKKRDLAETIEHWQYVDRLAGAYTERGVTINREPFGPLTGTLVPPSIAIAVGLVEGMLAATQGVRSVTLGYGQVGNLVQDIAALRALRSLGEEFLPDEVTVTPRYIPLFASTDDRIGNGWRDRGGFAGFGQHVRNVADNWDHVEVHPGVWSDDAPASSTSRRQSSPSASRDESSSPR